MVGNSARGEPVEPRTKTNYTLKFYDQVLRLGYIHYGFWEAGDPRTLDGLRGAQERYADVLASKVPKGVKRILDVGCGTGGMALKLKSKGFDVTGVSPDLYQQAEFSKRSGCPFILSKFENLREWPETDLILMAESVQYFSARAGFAKCKEILRGGGAGPQDSSDRRPRLVLRSEAQLRRVASGADGGGLILAADYFCKFKDGSKLTKSGHLESEYRAAGKEAGFEIEFEEDITEQTVPTLEFGFGWANQYALPAYDLLLEALRKRYPRLTRMALRMFGKKLDKIKNQLIVIDPDAFRRAKSYRLFLWRLTA